MKIQLTRKQKIEIPLKKTDKNSILAVKALMLSQDENIFDHDDLFDFENEEVIDEDYSQEGNKQFEIIE